MKTFRKYWLQLLLSVFVLVMFIGHAENWWHLGAVERLDLFLYDSRMALTMPRTIEKRVIVVDIDEKSLAEVGHWPWKRKIVAKLVDELVDHYKAAVVGFDIVFAEKDDTSGLGVLQGLADTELKDDSAFTSRFYEIKPQLDYDAIFAQSIAKRPVILGYYFNHDKRHDSIGQLPKPVLPAGIFKARGVAPLVQTGYGANLPVLMKNATGAGHFNPDPDSDGVTRRVGLLAEFEGNYYEPLSLAMVRAYLNFPEVEPGFEPVLFSEAKRLEWLKVGPLRIPVDDQIRAMVPYRGMQHSFEYVSASDILNQRVPFDVIAGRMVLIGTTAPGLNDLRVTPVDPIYPGVEIHANLISAMLTNSMPAQPSYLMGAEFLQLLLIGLVMIVVLIRLSPLAASLSTLSLLLLVLAGNFALWHQFRLAMPIASSVLLILVLYIITMAYGYFVVARNTKQIKSLFGQYVPPELVEKMSEEPEKYSMNGQSRELTVLFSDVRNFTSISESMEAGELGRFMNEFLTTLSGVIRSKYLGTIDKYMGDCVMAFWGAPIQDPDHAKNAVLAGLDMQKAILALAPVFREKGWPALNIGVGVNTGRMTVGDMGSQYRKAYTVMGDAVNLASRLEGSTKKYGVAMIVGESTREAVKDDILFREIGKIRVYGREEAVTIYEPICAMDEATKAIKSQVDLFHQALKHYRNQNWDMAELQLINLAKLQPDCQLYTSYLARINDKRKRPPPANWGGIDDLDSK